MLKVDHQEADKPRADGPKTDNQPSDILASNTPSALDNAASTPDVYTAATPTVSTLSPDFTLPATLSALSRNASVISTSSSDSGPASLLLTTPRPRPARTFSAPRSQSPRSRTPQSSIPPSYLAQELGMSIGARTVTSSAKSRSKSRSRNVAATVDDFKFGALLGEGSYSTVCSATRNDVH
jgi:3-phosphoinositide dependent protein kinase-1